MVETKKHLTKKWEISIIKFRNDWGIKYKLTRRIPDLSAAETKIFRSKEKAKEQFTEWLK